MKYYLTQIMVAPLFKYKILLDPNSEILGKFYILYRNDFNKYVQRELDENFVEVYTQVQLTQQQLLDMFDRTENIIGIRGDFKDENTIKNN